MERSLEIFFDFTNEDCSRLIGEIEKRKEEGFTVIWRSFVIEKTRPGHILNKWAEANGVGDQYKKMVFYYHFILNKDISDNRILEEIVDKLGFDEVKVEEVLKNEEFVARLGIDINRAIELNVSELPMVK